MQVKTQLRKEREERKLSVIHVVKNRLAELLTLPRVVEVSISAGNVFQSLQNGSKRTSRERTTFIQYN